MTPTVMVGGAGGAASTWAWICAWLSAVFDWRGWLLFVALAGFTGVKRRMELIHQSGGIRVYSDFAHHPTAIRLTLEGLRRNVGNARILVGMEPRSNTMRSGAHADELPTALMPADRVWLLTGDGIDWDPAEVLAPLEGAGRVVKRSADMMEQMLEAARPGDHVVFMSNGGFENVPARFCRALQADEDV